MSRRATSLSVVLGALCILSLSVMAGSASAAPFNVATDWSYTTNPNGAWSYRAGATPLPEAVFGWAGIPEIWWMTPAASGGPPAWTLTQTASPGWAYDWQVGDVIVHSTTPSSGVGDTNLTWTSPVEGTIDISGKIWDAYHYSDRDDSWSLALNGVVIAQRDSIRGVARIDPNAQLAANLVPGQSLLGLPVHVGDVLELGVHAQTFYGHFLGVDLTVETSRPGPVVPEPTSFLLLGSGLLGAFRAVRKRLV